MEEQIRDTLIEQLKEQEATLQFNYFDSDVAWQLGNILYTKAKNNGLKVTIDITMNNQQLFHCALPGTSPDNDQWILRKNKVVNRFFMSSYRMGQELKRKNKSIEESYMISSGEFSAHGGAFPIVLKNNSVVGTITVSGLPQAEDHQMVVEGIEEYLVLFQPEWIN